MTDRARGKSMTPHRTTSKPGESSLGAWIRGVRTGQGISQRALADRAGLSRSYLCDIERGRGTRPSVESLDKIATALGASRLELLRAAGILETRLVTDREREAERRLIALFRDVSGDGKVAIERFARFTHAEEHLYIQTRLIDDVVQSMSLDNDGFRRQGGPTLFDGIETTPAEDVAL